MHAGEDLSRSSSRRAESIDIGLTPSPWPRHVFLNIYLVIFCYGFQFMMVLPLLLPIIEQFVLETDGRAYFEEHKGVLMQVLVSAWYLSNCIGSMVWGRACDRFGRRPILLISLAGTSLSTMLLAFSASYSQMLIARVLVGFFDVTLFIAKTTLGDVCSGEDSSVRDKRFGSLMAWLAISLTVSPLVGPQLRRIGDEAFPTSVGFLPFTTLSVLLFLVFLACYLYFPETSRQFEEDLNTSSTRLASKAGASRVGWFRALAHKNVALCIVVYSMLVLLLTGSEMLVPLLTRESTEHFGLGLHDDWVSWFFAIQGIAFVISQLFFYPIIASQLNPVSGIRFAVAGLAIIIPAGFVPALAWSTVIMPLIMSTRVLIVSVALTSSVILIDNSATSETKGTVNGATQALASLTRCAGALIAGILFDFGRRRLSIFFPYGVFGVAMLGVWIITMMLPASLATPRPAEKGDAHVDAA